MCSMFQKNSEPRRTFVPVDAGLKSGHLWVRLSGLLRRQIQDRLFIPQSGIGSKLANHITGFMEAKLYGPPSGRRSKSLPASVLRNSADTLTMMLSIVNGEDLQNGSGTG